MSDMWHDKKTMRTAILTLPLPLMASAAAPVIADEECAAWCGDGKVWDDNKGECVIQPPKTS